MNPIESGTGRKFLNTACHDSTELDIPDNRFLIQISPPIHSDGTTDMTRILITTCLLVAMLCVANTGCLLNHSNHTVVRQQEPLRSVTFETEQARQVFEASAEAALEDDSNESRASFGVPFLVGFEKSKTIAPNAIRNDVATKFDINNDGHISEYEASLQKVNSVNKREALEALHLKYSKNF